VVRSEAMADLSSSETGATVVAFSIATASSAPRSEERLSTVTPFALRKESVTPAERSAVRAALSLSDTVTTFPLVSIRALVFSLILAAISLL